MNKIKIIHFIHGLNTGGAETLVKEYAVNLNRSVFDVLVLCMSHEDSPYEGILKKNNIKVICVDDYLPFWCRFSILKRTVGLIYKYAVVKNIICRESPDVLHTHLPINSFVKFAKPSGKTVVLHTVHNKPSELWSRDKKKRKKDFRAAKWLVRHRDMRFIVLHEKMRAEINKMFGVTDSIVLNNGVNVDRIKNARPVEVMRKELNIPEDAFVLGHIGRFSEVKNHTFLVDVFADVYKKGKNAFLLMIGDGPDKNKIIKKLDENGLRGSYLILSNRDDVPDLLSAMDVFVFPSLYEGLPLSLIEVQVAQKPCFVSDNVNEHATISNLMTKLSLNSGAKKWADAILSYKKPKKIVVNEDDWDIKKVTKRLEQIYLDVLAEKRNGKK